MGSVRRYVLDPLLPPSETEFLRLHLDAAGWEPTTGDDWTLNWCGTVHGAEVFAALRDGRIVNHFPGIAPLHYKDELAHFLSLAGHTFHPATFSMPWQYDALVDAMRSDPEALWLRKQKRSFAGDGMAILTEDMPIPREEDWIVQRYVANPLLLPGVPYKHVLRRYVVVTSLEPLTAFVHANGPVKFTSRPFSLSPAALRDPIVHLTNPPIQSTNTDAAADAAPGMDHDRYRVWLGEFAIDADALFGRVDAMLAATLRALHQPVLQLSRHRSSRLDCSFELLGFDVLIDDALDPWLLECNLGPALRVRGRAGSAQYAAQRRAKESLVHDVLSVVGLIDGPNRFEPLVTTSAGRVDRRPHAPPEEEEA